MTLFNQFEDKGQLAQVLQRRFNMTGSAPAPAIAPELFPGLTYENDRPEWGFYKNEIYAGVRVSLSAVAGQYSAMQLYLPSTANAICVITEIMHMGGTFGCNVQRAQGISAGVAPWTAVATQAADFRYGASRTQTICERYQAAGAPLGNGTIERIAGSGQQLHQPIIISPGTAMLLATDIVNSPIDVCIRWYERTAMPGELV